MEAALCNSVQEVPFPVPRGWCLVPVEEGGRLRFRGSEELSHQSCGGSVDEWCVALNKGV